MPDEEAVDVHAVFALAPRARDAVVVLPILEPGAACSHHGKPVIVSLDPLQNKLQPTCPFNACSLGVIHPSAPFSLHTTVKRPRQMEAFAGRRAETQDERDARISKSLIDGVYAIHPDIAGLDLIPSFVTAEEERRLMEFVDGAEWDTGLKRRVQHYGYKYDFLKKTVGAESRLRDLPEEFADICQRLERYGIHTPQQVIVNEYEPGQGIAPHIDANLFGPAVCTLSCLHEVPMTFQLDKGKIEIPMPRRSLAVLRGPAREVWRHSIASRMSDRKDRRKVRRSRRVSFTFRTVNEIR